MEEVLDKLHLLEDPHSEYVLLRNLRNCFSLPKLSYALRTVDPAPHSSTLTCFDLLMRESLERVFRAPLLDEEWSQAKLPVSLGGLGLRSAIAHAPGAYLVSLGESVSIREDIRGKKEPVNGDKAVQLLSAQTGEEVDIKTVMVSTQKAFSYAVDLRSSQELRDRLTGERDRARLNLVGLPRAGDWLNDAHIRALGLHL